MVLHGQQITNFVFKLLTFCHGFFFHFLRRLHSWAIEHPLKLYTWGKSSLSLGHNHPSIPYITDLGFCCHPWQEIFSPTEDQGGLPPFCQRQSQLLQLFPIPSTIWKSNTSTEHPTHNTRHRGRPAGRQRGRRKRTTLENNPPAPQQTSGQEPRTSCVHAVCIC